MNAIRQRARRVRKAAAGWSAPPAAQAPQTPLLARGGPRLWSKAVLHDLIEEKLRGYKFIVVSNREPYIHRYAADGAIRCIQPASGMATALDPVMMASGGTWIAHGSGDADQAVVDAQNRVQVPPDSPSYTLRRVWLTREQEEGYYYGLANAGLWPLCHVTFTRPVFDPRHWKTYREVNEVFAKAVLEEAGGQPTFVFVQDFHFCLLPRLLKQASLGNLIVAMFWHIPWPSRHIFRSFPWAEELLDGMLGNDLLGFHINSHCQNFLETVDRTLEAKVDLEHMEIARQGKTTVVRPFPISIDFDDHVAEARTTDVAARIAAWRTRLGLKPEQKLGIGIERLDFTKGIPDRLRGLDWLFETHPEQIGKLIFLQVAVPSRAEIPQYRQIGEEVDELTEQLNRKWARGAWRPIVLLKEHQGRPDMMALHRLADFCVVSSLHDGMNLVAKEFVASRFDEDGALILSKFTGSARELTDALLVNPFAVHEIAEAMHQAVTMAPDERRRRMSRMRAEVERNNVYRWAGKALSALLKFDFPEIG